MKTLLSCMLSLCAVSVLFAESTDNSKMTSGDKMEAHGYCAKLYPCDRVSYEIFGEVVFLQPNGSDLYYAVEAFPFDTAITVPPISPNWQVFEIKPDYDAGFEVGFKTIFPNTYTNIEASWERLHTHDSASMTVSETGNMVGPIFDIGPNSAVYTAAKGKATFRFDEVDLLFGKKVCFWNHLFLNLQAGASFARIKQTMSSTYSNESTSNSRSIHTPSTFTGAGTKFNVDFKYQIYKGFSFTGNSAISLFMGQLKNSTTFKSFSPSLANLDIPEPNIQKTTVPNRSQLIPGFEEKLGFCYAMRFKNCIKVMFDVGYQFQIFVNAVQTFDMTAPQVLPSLAVGAAVIDGVYAVGFERTLSNFILSGPYIAASICF